MLQPKNRGEGFGRSFVGNLGGKFNFVNIVNSIFNSIQLLFIVHRTKTQTKQTVTLTSDCAKTFCEQWETPKERIVPLIGAPPSTTIMQPMV